MMCNSQQPRSCRLLLVAAGIAFASALQLRTTWPNGPFSVSGRWMVDASGANVTYAGVNWPGHVETMVPEGLQYQSVEAIVSQIKSLGMNAIRLTYAIEMIDDIYENDGNDISIQSAFVNALGQENGTEIFHKVLTNNPSFNNDTTRLQVFDAVASECAKQEIYVHLDNQVSKAGWCCTPFDGNSWWGDAYFSASNWTRGLSYMANHGKSWSNLMSMSLRNELRQPFDNVTVYNTSYNWADWYKYMQQGASAIHTNNSDVLIFLSGLNSDTNLSVVVDGSPLQPSSSTFKTADFSGYANKLVLELHNYENSATDCTALENELYIDGFRSLDGPANATNVLPVLMTEFGFTQDATTWQSGYAACLESYLPAQHAGWMIWVVAGSYYIRQGTQDADESYGLLTHDWSAWRSPQHIDGGLKPMVQKTLAYLNGSSSAGNQSSGGGGSDSAGNGSKPSSASGRHEGFVASVFSTWLIALALAVLFSVGMSL